MRCLVKAEKWGFFVHFCGLFCCWFRCTLLQGLRFLPVHFGRWGLLRSVFFISRFSPFLTIQKNSFFLFPAKKAGDLSALGKSIRRRASFFYHFSGKQKKTRQPGRAGTSSGACAGVRAPTQQTSLRREGSIHDFPLFHKRGRRILSYFSDRVCGQKGAV